MDKAAEVTKTIVGTLTLTPGGRVFGSGSSLGGVLFSPEAVAVHGVLRPRSADAFVRSISYEDNVFGRAGFSVGVPVGSGDR